MGIQLLHTLVILSVFVTANMLFFFRGQQAEAFFLVLMVILLEISILVTRVFGTWTKAEKSDGEAH